MNIHCTMGVIQTTLGIYAEATEHFEKVIEISSTNQTKNLISVDSMIPLRALINMAFIDLL